MSARTAAAALALAAALAGPVAFDSAFDGEADGAAVNIWARASDEAASVTTDPAVRLREYKRMADCDPSAVGTEAGSGVCLPVSSPAEFSALPGCEGEEPVQPLWMRERATAASAWGPWRNVMGWTCPADYAPVFTAEDFRRLPLAPPVLGIQPATGEHLVTMPAIAYTQAPAQTLTTDLLGVPVQVEATPTSYTWDFGDGTTTITTTSPGHPYPDHDVTHPYTKVGTWTITLTTAYTGRYTLAEDPTWHTINGTATTTTTSAPITTVEAPTRLVQDACTTHNC